MFDFHYFNKTLTEKMVDSPKVKSDNFMIICEIIFREIDVADIDFDSFTLEELKELEEDFEQHICFIDDDGAEDMLVTDEHWFSVLNNFDSTITKLNGLPKIKPKPPFKFI